MGSERLVLMRTVVPQLRSCAMLLLPVMALNQLVTANSPKTPPYRMAKGYFRTIQPLVGWRGATPRDRPPRIKPCVNSRVRLLMLSRKMKTSCSFLELRRRLASAQRGRSAPPRHIQGLFLKFSINASLLILFASQSSKGRARSRWLFGVCVWADWVCYWNCKPIWG